MPDLHDLSALEQAARLRAGELSPVELVDHYLARIDRHSEVVGAFVEVTDEPARAAAKDAESALRASTRSLPPLFGVPTAIKDLNLTAGVPTRFGSVVMRDFVAPLDDNVVTRMTAAGLISLGKTNTPEFGLPCYTEPEIAPPARTPWDLNRSAGGSSGGAAAAVAAGLVPLAQGSDGGGSIRIPASVTGLVGIKTTRGRISNGPVLSDLTGLMTMGPLAHTVRDAAALLDAMAGQMPGDPYFAPPPDRPFLDYADREPGRLRVGRYLTPPVPDAQLHPDCEAAWESASRLLADLGHEVEDVEPPFDSSLIPQFETVWAVSAASAPVDPAREGELRPLTQWLRERGRAVSAVAFAQAMAAIALATRAAAVATAGYDVILTPTLARPPARVGELRDDADPARDFDNQKRFTPYTAAYNATGQPAVSLPLYWSAAGLPIGVMLAGRPAAEGTLISLAAQLEAAQPWRDRTPDLW